MNKYLISLKELQGKGIDFTKNYFSLSNTELFEVDQAAKNNGYKYTGKLGRSVSLNYYYKLQRLFRNINK